jgi:putative methanogen marker protein 4
MITLGIGCGTDAAKVLRSAQLMASDSLCVRCYGSETCTGGYAVPHQALIDDLVSGRLDGAVRGTLPANETLAYLKSACGVAKLERIALLETADGTFFFLAPVGIDEGWTVGEKTAFVEKGRRLAKRFGLPEKACILSGGRLGDTGRHPVVDRTILEAQETARLTGAVHGEILIENALPDCGVVIAPDGISGNLIFRTLVFLGNGRGHGAPVVNIGPVFVDSSRASPDYTMALKLAALLAEGEKRKDNG